MENIFLSWIGTGSCEPGDEALTFWAPVVGGLSFIVATIVLWVLYKDANKSALSTSDRAVNLIMFILGLGLVGGGAFVIWFMMALSGACSG